MKLEVINEAEIVNKRKLGISITYLLNKFNDRERVKSFEEELANLRERMDRALSLKFVVVKREGEIVVKIFHSDHIHLEGLEPDNKGSFVGAGRYFSTEEVEWDAFSFREEFQRDRPENPKEREEILDKIRGAIQEWIGMLIQANLRKPTTKSISEL